MMEVTGKIRYVEKEKPYKLLGTEHLEYELNLCFLRINTKL